MTVGQSQFVKNGQMLKVNGGTAAIAQGALALMGGPGVEAWPVATIDYAVQAAAGAILSNTSIGAVALPGPNRQPVCRDRLGNIYVAGTNGSGRLVIQKFGPTGTLLLSAILDATATAINGAELFQIQSGAFVCVYARAAGVLQYVVFDTNLTSFSANGIATERASGNVVYHSSCALSGGGFAVAYQTSAGTGITLATYSNTGVSVASVNVQTLAGTAAQQFIRLTQLATSGNLVVAYRGTMTAGGTAGTSFTVVTPAGTNVAGPTSFDTTSSLGLLEVNAFAGFFALATGNGTNLVTGVFSEAGAQQGSTYSVGNTLNTVNYPQTKLTNDGLQFWLVWQSNVVAGVNIIPIATSGASGVAATGLGAASITTSAYAIDAAIINNQAVVLAAANGTAGQFVIAIGLPDASLGSYAPYVRTAAFALGTAAATTGSAGPRLMSGGGGLYSGANPPNGQPSPVPGCGDFTFIAVYDQQNVAATFMAIQKLEASGIIGICQRAFVINNPGGEVDINPGEGEYPTLLIAGTYGTTFNHLSANPVGTAGALYQRGVGLAGITGVGSQVSSRVAIVEDFAADESAVPLGAVLCNGASYSIVGTMAALFAKIQYKWGGSGANFNVPDLRGTVTAGAENMGGTNRGNLGNNSSVGGIAGTASLGTSGGAKDHAPVIGELVSHNHTYNGASSAATQPNQGGGAAPGSFTTGNTGGGANFNITQPTACMNKIIWFA